MARRRRRQMSSNCGKKEPLFVHGKGRLACSSSGRNIGDPVAAIFDAITSKTNIVLKFCHSCRMLIVVMVLLAFGGVTRDLRVVVVFRISLSFSSDHDNTRRAFWNNAMGSFRSKVCIADPPPSPIQIKSWMCRLSSSADGTRVEFLRS